MMKKITDRMIEALEFVARRETGDSDSIPDVPPNLTTNTWAALVDRGLITPGAHAWVHQLTEHGRTVAADLFPGYGEWLGR